jgi:cytochrome d ubiquinol oxidase subunit I
MLSWLYFFKAEGEVPGIQNLQAQYAKQYGPGNYIPPVTLTYFAFRGMVGAGFLMVGLAFLALFLVVTKRLARFPWFLTGLTLAIFLPYLANSTGWLVTEVGRQPWIVQGLMKTENAVSPVLTGETVLLSLLLFTLLYGALMVFDIYLLAKYARHDPMEATPVGAY